MAFTTLALMLMLGSTAVSVVGGIKAGRAQKKAGEEAGAAAAEAGAASARAALAGGAAQQRSAEANAQLSDYNAQVADLQADDAGVRGTEDESRIRQNVRQVIGAQRAGFAAGNIDVAYGSAVDVQADAAYLGELDAQTAKTNAAREAWGFKVQAVDLRAQAKITRQEGASAVELAGLDAEALRVGGESQRRQLVAQGKAANSAAKWNAASTVIGAGSSLLMQRYGLKH